MCIFPATGAFAQTNKPYSALEDDSAKWIFPSGSGLYADVYGQITIYFSKDTSIENINWRKFDIVSMHIADGDTFEHPQLPVFLRVDDSAQMIYQYFLGEGEYLQYDFTLLPGDVGHFLAHDRNNGSFNHGEYWVIKIDSLVRNGAYVKYIHIGDSTRPHTWDTLWYDVINTREWLPGLWPTMGDFALMGPGPLNCYTGTNYYYSPLGRDCDFMYPLSVPQEPKALTCAQVNRMGGVYEIVSRCQGPVNVSVYDLSGRLMHSSTVRDTLRLPPLEQGIYILQMVAPDKGQQSSMKITY